MIIHNFVLCIDLIKQDSKKIEMYDMYQAGALAFTDNQKPEIYFRRGEATSWAMVSRFVHKDV